ncbi:hypothetical protein B0H17DRAFT_1257678 [Mycena rosella]|uniref:Uncharacterized protein n=1 Tax=Mycena rosella TaxID=1033263 RepID=A0AAD7G5V8_MYCRO|nr:hypothetical protein B0H17DRAFT_1257678 [Mycena rosella]
MSRLLPWSSGNSISGAFLVSTALRCLTWTFDVIFPDGFSASWIASWLPFTDGGLPIRRVPCCDGLLRTILRSSSAVVRRGVAGISPEAFPLVNDSPSDSDSRSLSKFTSYSYAEDDAAATLDVTSFSADGFSDFKLDLACLSTTPSPPPSPPPPSDYPFSSYLPSSPPSSSRRSVSFSTGPSPSLGRVSSAPRLSTSPRISLISAPSNIPGSWPLSRYVGRGTPIDPSRRSEWGGRGPGGEDVAEDGVLFSTVRSTSIDSVPQPSQRSISPLTEWNYISPPPVVYKPYSERRRSTVSLEPLPESAKIHLDGLDPNSSAEWASSMQMVLASPISASASTSTPELSSETHFESAMESVEELRTPEERSEARERAMSEMDLGLESLNAAVDQGLGLIPGGMTWFDVGILPSSGRASPSVYSCDQPSTPQISRPRSVNQSYTEAEMRFPLRERFQSRLWWQRFLNRLRRLRASLIMLRRRRSEV